MTLSRRAWLRGGGLLAAPWLLGRPGVGGAGPARVNVRDLGAHGHGRTKDTRALQAAIDVAAASAGIVDVPPGEYVCGTLHLRSGITLRLAAGATLIASPDDADFDPPERLPYESFADEETTDFGFALLRGHGLRNVRLLGPGRIDGNRTRRGGPKPIALKQCHAITLRDLTLDNAPNYNISLLGCDGVDIRGITIRNGYSDGIDPDCCRNVRIADCRIESRDDAIVAKASLALGVRRSTENIVVTDCALVNVRNALKLGTESSGDFRNIVFRNCTITARREGRKPYPQEWKPQPSAGVSLEAVDGGRLEHVVVSGITMVGVGAPIFVRLARRGRGQSDPVAGELKNVSISDIVATGVRWTSSITGIPGHPVSDITLRNVRSSGRGGRDDELTLREVPQHATRYPDATMYSNLPAHGLYCRHVRRLSVERMELTVEQPDERPAVILDDVRETSWRTVVVTPPADDGPALWLRSVRDCLLRDVRSPAAETLVRLSGPETARIRLAGRAPNRRRLMLDADVDASAVRAEET